jgi:hypothetical protein
LENPPHPSEGDVSRCVLGEKIIKTGQRKKRKSMKEKGREDRDQRKRDCEKVKFVQIGKKRQKEYVVCK